MNQPFENQEYTQPPESGSGNSGEREMAESPSAAPVGEMTCLDPRVIPLWRVGQAISSTVIMGILAVAALVVSWNFRGAFKFAIAGWILMLLFRLFMFFWYPPRAYRAWRYRLDGKVLETHSGVFFQVIQLLPLSRLQHVDLHRGPVERYFGLASLVLHTAGTVQSALVVPGLAFEEGSRLRDQLVAIGGDDAV